MKVNGRYVLYSHGTLHCILSVVVTCRFCCDVNFSCLVLQWGGFWGDACTSQLWSAPYDKTNY